MKNFLIILLAMFFLSGCGKESSDSLLGKWNCKENGATMLITESNGIYTINISFKDGVTKTENYQSTERLDDGSIVFSAGLIPVKIFYNKEDGETKVINSSSYSLLASCSRN